MEEGPAPYLGELKREREGTWLLTVGSYLSSQVKDYVTAVCLCWYLKNHAEERGHFVCQDLFASDLADSQESHFSAVSLLAPQEELLAAWQDPRLFSLTEEERFSVVAGTFSGIPVEALRHFLGDYGFLGVTGGGRKMTAT